MKEDIMNQWGPAFLRHTLSSPSLPTRLHFCHTDNTVALNTTLLARSAARPNSRIAASVAVLVSVRALPTRCAINRPLLWQRQHF